MQYGSLQVVTEEDLTPLAREAFDETPLTQSELARMLGVSRHAVNKALRDPTESMTKLRLKIIRVLGKKEFIGPVYIHQPKNHEQPNPA
jgi:DNA-binding XRE family transcriptional regulator